MITFKSFHWSMSRIISYYFTLLLMVSLQGWLFFFQPLWVLVFRYLRQTSSYFKTVPFIGFRFYLILWVVQEPTLLIRDIFMFNNVLIVYKPTPVRILKNNKTLIHHLHLTFTLRLWMDLLVWQLFFFHTRTHIWHTYINMTYTHIYVCVS